MRLPSGLLSRVAPVALAVLAAPSLVACGSKPPPPAEAPKPTTRYRVGDWVVYRYSGSFTKEPVVVREEVVERKDLTLRIAVRAQRGVDRRTWVQVVTDTKENREANKVDALFLEDHGTLKPLANTGNRDLRELWSWTVLTPDAPSTKDTPTKRDVKIGATTFPGCDVTTGEATFAKRKLRFEEVVCEEFLWKHAGATWTDPENGEEVYRAEVVGFGHD